MLVAPTSNSGIGNLQDSENLRRSPQVSQDKPEDDPSKIRRHFRRETGKLDNWIYHRRLDEYLRREKGDAEKR